MAQISQEAIKEAIKEALDVQVEQPDFDAQVREKLLGVFTLAAHDRELYTGDRGLRSWNGQGLLPPLQRIDRLEYFSGYPPHRHQWMHDLEHSGGTQVNFTALIKRMNVLQTTDQRDLELERATIEMGSLLLMRPDENSNMFLQGIQVRALEVYRAQEGEPRREERVAGFSLQWGGFHFGETAGFTGENAHRWFVAGSGYYAPLDRITEFPKHWHENGGLVGTEYAPRPLAQQG